MSRTWSTIWPVLLPVALVVVTFQVASEAHLVVFRSLGHQALPLVVAVATATGYGVARAFPGGGLVGVIRGSPPPLESPTPPARTRTRVADAPPRADQEDGP